TSSKRDWSSDVCSSDLVSAGGIGPVSIRAGDFNGDGAVDLAVLNGTSGDVVLLLGNGAGSFAAGPPLPVGRQPVFMTSGDLDARSEERRVGKEGRGGGA